MAGKISELTALTDMAAVTKDDLSEAVNGGVNKKIRAGVLLDALLRAARLETGQPLYSNGSGGVTVPGYQPLDSELTALAGLTFAADCLIRGTGTGTVDAPIFGANTFPANNGAGLAANAITARAFAFLAAATASDMSDAIGLADVAKTGSYNNLIDQPDIPDLSGYAPLASPVFTGGAAAIPVVAKGGAARTVPILQLQTSAGASLGNVGGCVFDDYADAATTHTDGTFDTLLTHLLPANALAVNGDKVEFDCTIKIVGHALSTDRIKVTVGGIAVFDSTAQNYAVGATIRVYGQVMRKSETTCRATVEFFAAGSATIFGYSTVQYTDEAVLTGMTLTGTNSLVVTAAATGTNSATGDVTLVMGTINIIPAGS